MKARRLLIGGTAAGLTATALFFGGALRGSPTASSAPVANPAPAADDTATQISKLQGELRASRDDVYALDALGLAYQQRARETGDPTYYTKSDEVLRRALRLAPRDLLATSGLGSLALSRHRFREALTLGRRARAISPTTARNYGVIGDALVELGRYRQGFQAFDTMAGLRPDVSSYSRIGHARLLLGDVAGARSALRLALDASLGQGETEAWTRVQLSKAAFSVGSIAPALAQARAALRAFPGYAPAYDALAWAEYGRGHVPAAITAEQEAVNRIPLPQYVATLGDLQEATGRNAQARRQYALINVIQRLLVANGVETDLETALFDVDHGIRLPASLALARRAQRERPSIDGDDVLAWALEQTGHCGEAQGYSKRALRLGTLDALKFFHRGMIEQCLGDRAAAASWFRRSLALNPRFSVLWAPVARRALR
jgi:tetratricopeptide (TPR) repeat protein